MNHFKFLVKLVILNTVIFISNKSNKPNTQIIKNNMGGSISFLSTAQHDWKQNQTLLVGTLNYGGILNSPFQFYSDTNQAQRKITQKLSKTFRKLLQKYSDKYSFNPQKEKQFKWQLGKIDKQIQTRYTPIYKKEVGIYQNQLINKATFEKLWDEQWKVQLAKFQQKQRKEQQKKDNKGSKVVFSASQIQVARSFDFLCYHAIVSALYNENCTQTLDQIVERVKDASEYKKLMNRYFSRAYLDQNKKIIKLMEVFKKNFYPNLTQTVEENSEDSKEQSNSDPKKNPNEEPEPSGFLEEEIELNLQKNLKSSHNKEGSQFNIIKKISQVKTIIQRTKTIDVMFFQQPTQRLINCLKFYPKHSQFLNHQKNPNQQMKKRIQKYKEAQQVSKRLQKELVDQYEKQYSAKDKIYQFQQQIRRLRKQMKKSQQKVLSIRQKIVRTEEKISQNQISIEQERRKMGNQLLGKLKQDTVPIQNELKQLQNQLKQNQDLIKGHQKKIEQNQYGIREKNKEINQLKTKQNQLQKQLQQAIKQRQNQLKQYPLQVYGTVKTGIIAVRKQRFKKRQSILKFYSPKRIQQILDQRKKQNKQHQYQLQIKYENWPVVKQSKQTTTIVCDNYIFINIHLSSKKPKNKLEVGFMKQTLNMLAGIRDSEKQYEILIGGDTNSYVNNDDLEDFYIFPKYQHHFTTNKKRTFLQPQFDKAEQMVTQCKDHLITTLPMITRGRTQIGLQGLITQKKLLPTTNHPFDHFMVLCLLKGQQS